MKTKHTPAPWIQSHRKYQDGMYSTEVYDQKGKAICTLAWYPIDEGNGVVSTAREANAKLIASAPELLETLQSIDKFFANENNTDIKNTNETRKLWDSIRKAIKKATS